MDLAAFAPLAKLRGVERSGLKNAEVFAKLDVDGSGTLSKAEVGPLKELVATHEAEKLKNQNDDDFVTYAQFEAMFQPGGECK
jgi:Ca2+-binding EF-hand superfamily protein